jgi:hypothetical protein
MKYAEKHFSLRIHRRDVTSKLLLGVTGSRPKVGSLKQIKVAEDEVLTVSIVDRPRSDEPAEAVEVPALVRRGNCWRLRREGR